MNVFEKHGYERETTSCHAGRRRSGHRRTCVGNRLHPEVIQRSCARLIALGNRQENRYG